MQIELIDLDIYESVLSVMDSEWMSTGHIRKASKCGQAVQVLRDLVHYGKAEVKSVVTVREGCLDERSKAFYRLAP